MTLLKIFRFKYIINVVSLILFAIPLLWANDSDSLVLRYHASQDPDTRAIIAYQILSKNFGTNPSLANPYLLDAVNDTIGIDATNLANCYKGLAITYFYKGLYDSAILFSNRALYHFRGLKSESQVSTVLKNRALSLSGKGEYAAAISDYMISLDVERTRGDTARIAGNLNDIGNTYIKIRNYREGMKFQREALQYLKTYNNPAILGNVLNSIGNIFDVGKINRDSAIFYYTESLKIKERHGTVYSIINTKNNLCSCYDLDKKLKEFTICFRELLALQEKVSDVPGLVRSNVNLANALRKTGNPRKALAHLESARVHAHRTDDPTLLADVYHKLSGLYKDQGQHKLALGAFERHLEFKDSAYYRKRNELTLEMASRYELEKKNREIAETNARLATAENERLVSLGKVRSRNAWLGSLSMLLILGLSVGVALTQRLRRRKQSEKSAAVLAERDRGLKAIIDAQEDERTRIARDLHDGVGNNLLALHMQLQQGKQEGEDWQSTMLRRLSHVMDEVRSVSHEMMPKVLQEFGCVPAIRDMLDRSLDTGRMTHSFETHNCDKRYNPRIETAVYRITQELINNIIKHSNANQVSVQLIDTGGTLVLFVEDNGKGANYDKGSEGIGLTNIKTRLAAIDGEINISSGEVGGTVASIRIPLS